MSQFPRAVYPVGHVERPADDQQIVKYMPLWKFEDLITNGSLYLRRIDNFKDTDPFEGTIPLAVWSLECDAIQQWYNRCKEEIFVSCWNLDEHEAPHMWHGYAGNCGVRIRTTVGALVAELTQPPLPPIEPYSRAIVDYVAQAGGQIAEVDVPPHDGFNIGLIKYLDFNNIDIHAVLGEGPSNATPAFRKRNLPAFVAEHECRVILRSGSASGDEARHRGQRGVHARVGLANLIQEIRYAPSNSAAVRNRIELLLARHNLTVPVIPTTLSHLAHGLSEEHLAVAAYFIWELEDERRHGRDKIHWDRAIEGLLIARSLLHPS